MSKSEPVFDKLVDYILFAKQHKALSAMALYFEQIVNGLVYELYFENALRKAGISLLPNLLDTILPSLPAEGEVKAIEEVYQELYDKQHPVRIGLFKLDTVPEVRLIEGRDK